MIRFAYPGYADSIPMSAFNVGRFAKANDHNDNLKKFEFCRCEVFIRDENEPG